MNAQVYINCMAENFSRPKPKYSIYKAYSNFTLTARSGTLQLEAVEGEGNTVEEVLESLYAYIYDWNGEPMERYGIDCLTEAEYAVVEADVLRMIAEQK